jgi:hypothetical protein
LKLPNIEILNTRKNSKMIFKIINMIKTSVFIVLGSLLLNIHASGKRDSILTHKVEYDAGGKILGWFHPDYPGASYDKVINLASNFIKNICPVEPSSGLPLYMVHAWYSSPKEAGREKFEKGLSGSDDGFTPACTFENFVQSFVLGYFPYSGDSSYIGILRKCLDHLIEYGTTPSGWKWPDCPYASANPRSPEYYGATHWGVGGRNDGPYVIEPDKVGDIGIQFLNFYKVTGKQLFFEAAVKCADALVKNVRNTPRKQEGKFFSGILQSPWPFRVCAENGQVLEEYTSNVVGALKLFDELILLKTTLQLNENKVAEYRKTRNLVWEWLYSTEGPMKTFVWKGYFEDMPNDPNNKNLNQITPLEFARYLIKNPGLDPDMDINVPAIINWVTSAFKTKDKEAITEQFWCYWGMGSHTARYASICALWYEKTKIEQFKEEAYRSFNWSTYLCTGEGYVITGPEFPSQYWFSDGYGDYVRHFIEGIAAVPEWAPQGENHLLRTSSVIKSISYQPSEIRYVTFDNESQEVLRLSSKPINISVNDKIIKEIKSPDGEGWTWKSLEYGGILRLRKATGDEIKIRM